MFSGILVLRNAKYEGSLYETQYISRQAGVQPCAICAAGTAFIDDVSNSRACKNMGLLSHEMAKELIEKPLPPQKTAAASIFCSGRRTDLAGLDFFRFFLETERSMQRKISVFHSIQTNGICLDEEWASFFKTNSFLVGISLDGTQENHDLYRLDAAGQGTWDKVTSTIALLDAYGVRNEPALCCDRTVGKKAAASLQEPLRVGTPRSQFIPALTRLTRLAGRHIL